MSSADRKRYAGTMLSMYADEQVRYVLGMAIGQTKKTAEKRLRGMFMRRHSSRRGKMVAVLLTAVLLMTCFTTACQPTPEELIVQNKADDELKEAIAQTASPVTESSLTNNLVDHITETDTNGSNTVTVNIDADVTIPNASKIAVAQVEETTISIEKIEQIVEAFYGKSTLYDLVTTKEDIQANMLRMQLSLSDDEALLNSSFADVSGSTDLSYLRSLVNDRIEELKISLQDAPEERPEIDGYDAALTEQGLMSCVDIGDDYLGYVQADVNNSFGQAIDLYAFGGDYSKRYRTLEYRFSTQIELDTKDAEFQNAKQMAETMIGDMGIDGVKLGEAYLSGDYTGNEEVSSDREFYVFCFERIVGDGTVDFNFISNMINESPTEAYGHVLPYERIQIWIEGDEFRQFTWKAPTHVKEIINENVAVAIDYERAIKLMKQQAFVQFADCDDERGTLFSAYEIDINSISLELVRIKEKDTGNYLIVPAWVFCGQVNSAVTQAYIDVLEIEDVEVGEYVPANNFLVYSDAIMTINALDGSVIDVNAGY